MANSSSMGASLDRSPCQFHQSRDKALKALSSVEVEGGLFPQYKELPGFEDTVALAASRRLIQLSAPALHGTELTQKLLPHKRKRKTSTSPFGEWFRAKRWSKGFNQAETADLLAVHPSLIYFYENGSCHPTKRIQERISSLFEIPGEELFSLVQDSRVYGKENKRSRYNSSDFSTRRVSAILPSSVDEFYAEWASLSGVPKSALYRTLLCSIHDLILEGFEVNPAIESVQEVTAE